MSLKGFIPRQVEVPRGAWMSVANRRSGTPARASYTQNMRIRYGTCRTRPGTSAVFAANGKVTSIFNWISPWGANLVLYQDADQVRVYNQATAVAATLVSGLATTRSSSFAPIDVWTYICGSNTTGDGTFQTEIYDGANVDKAFRPAPVITSWTAIDGGAGQCTQGQHFIGFVYQNRTGYSGIPVTSISYAITATNNGAPDTATIPGHNLQVGQTVTITGATGDTAINGTRIVTSVVGAAVQFTDSDGNAINGNGAYAGGGIVTNPIQVTLNAGLRQISISVGLPAMPDGGLSANGGVQATLFLIATRSDNPAIWYFMPTDTQTGEIGEQLVPLNAPTTLHFVMSLSDEDIANALAGDTAQKNFLFLAQDANGAGPFNPNFVVAYGQRMCYGAGTTLYVSDIAAPQQIAADTNAIRMTNQRTIGAAFPLPGSPYLYLCGDGWTGYVNDNSDSPSTWSQPVGVSDALGAPFPNCVCPQTKGNYVWVVTPSGPYLFDGEYEGMPLTYLCSGLDENHNAVGWSRVNWKAAYAIQIKDDTESFKLYVAVPLDDATECNYMFCIDYRMGKTYDTVDISLDVFNPQLFSSIGVVKEIGSGKLNLWIGPEAAGNVARLDPTTHNDQGLAINGFWKSGLIRGNEIQSTMVRAGYLDLWIRGNGTLGIVISSLDNKTSVTPFLQNNMGVPTTLVDQPGQVLSAKYDLAHVPDLTIQVGTNAVDEWFEMSGFSVFMKPDFTNR